MAYEPANKPEPIQKVQPVQKAEPIIDFGTPHKSDPVLKSEPAPKTVKMKFVAKFNGTEKVVELPIPLLATSQKLNQQLIFTRPAGNHGPAYCDVPMEWADKLLAIGGSFLPADEHATKMQSKIDIERVETDARKKKFDEENTVSQS